jgi:hypothetical protein
VVVYAVAARYIFKLYRSEEHHRIGSFTFSEERGALSQLGRALHANVQCLVPITAFVQKNELLRSANNNESRLSTTTAVTKVRETLCWFTQTHSGPYTVHSVLFWRRLAWLQRCFSF